LRNETPGHKNSLCLHLEGENFEKKKGEEGKLPASKSKFRQMSEGLKDVARAASLAHHGQGPKSSVGLMLAKHWL
jgi:hypothetical protein